jgi:hypothetical protein
LMQSSTPVAVTVRDAETKAPVPGAKVVIFYPNTDPSVKTRELTAITDASGNAQIRGVTSDDGLPQVKIAAPGYILEQSALRGDALRSIKANNSFWSLANHHDPVEYEMSVYRGPAAAVELLVPVGYRGLIKIDVRIREDIVYPPGQRVFIGTVADGAVQVDGSPLLRSECKPMFRARYTNDTLVPMNVPDNEVGFRWLRTEGRTELFVIGTQADCDNYRRITDKSAAVEATGKKNGGGGGGGGGGRRGGGSGMGGGS